MCGAVTRGMIELRSEAPGPHTRENRGWTGRYGPPVQALNHPSSYGVVRHGSEFNHAHSSHTGQGLAREAYERADERVERRSAGRSSERRGRRTGTRTWLIAEAL